MKMSEFTYNLPDENIAKFPPKKRGSTNLLIVDRENENLKSKKYFNIPDYIDKRDVVVLNETRVSKRRTFFRNTKGRIIEVLFLEKLDTQKWYCLVKGARYLKKGDILQSVDIESIEIEIGKRVEDGFLIHTINKTAEEIFELVGHTPIPPYMKREDTKDDYNRYNTVFSCSDGSVASPTASLNLTDEILKKIEERGAKIVKVELQIGWGTFAPIREENIEEHKIHTEKINITKDVVDIVNSAKQNGKKIWAFGTTVARTLESVADKDGKIHEYSGSTNLYIYPGYRWKCVDCLVTNFHMPDSSLILLVSSFAGKGLIKKAYSYALENNYKFLSYGDSMLIL